MASRSWIVAAQRAAGVVVLQVADVLAHERLTVDDQRHGVLEVGAEREHRPRDRERRHGAGRVAAAPAEDHRPERPVAHDRVLHPAGDRPLAHERRVGQPGQALASILVLVRDRLARPVGARHDQEIGRAGGEE